MTPVDLNQYADRYHLGWDEATTIPGQSQEDRAWLRLIPCKLGDIFPWSETELAATVFGRKKAKEAERLPFVTVAQGGGPGCGEVVVRFSPDYLNEMTEFMGARRRRRLSADHRRGSFVLVPRIGSRRGRVRAALPRRRRTSGDLRPADTAASGWSRFLALPTPISTSSELETRCSVS